MKTSIHRLGLLVLLLSLPASVAFGWGRGGGFGGFHAGGFGGFHSADFSGFHEGGFDRGSFSGSRSFSSWGGAGRWGGMSS